MKKGIVLLSLLSCLGLTSITNMQSKDIVASSSSYKLAFLSDAEDLAKSESNFNGSYSVKDGELKFSRTDSLTSVLIYPNGLAYSFEANKSYLFSFDVNANNNVHISFSINSPWQTLKEAWLYSSSDYDKWECSFTPTSTFGSALIFQLSAGSGDVSIKNLFIREVVETKELASGETIGTLPSLSSKDGNEGVWTIDGETINEKSTFVYNEDKYALPYYPETFSISFFDDNKINKHQWMGTSGWWSTSPSKSKYSYKDGIVTLDMASGTSIMHDVNLAAGDSYRFVAKYRTNESTKFHLAWCNDWASLVKSNLSSSSWSELSWTFTAPSSIATSWLEFNIPSNGKASNNLIELQDMKLFHISKKKVMQGEEIGELPSCPEGTNYYIGEERITSETIYSYSEDKEAYLAPNLSYMGEPIVTRIGRPIDESSFAFTDYYNENIKPVYSYRWVKDNDDVSLDEPSEPGNYTLYAKGKGSFGISSNEVAISVTLLERDSTPPSWNKGDKPYNYPNNLTIEVIYLTYACFNLEAIDDNDGIISVSYDYGDTVDILGRFIKSGLVIATAKDSSNNSSTININVVVIGA